MWNNINSEQTNSIIGTISLLPHLGLKIAPKTFLLKFGNLQVKSPRKELIILLINYCQV